VGIAADVVVMAAAVDVAAAMGVVETVAGTAAVGIAVDVVGVMVEEATVATAVEIVEIEVIAATVAAGVQAVTEIEDINTLKIMSKERGARYHIWPILFPPRPGNPRKARPIKKHPPEGECFL
jgi:hypothetical protein